MKAALRRHWVSRYIRDTGVDDSTATIAFETWWRQSFMAWLSNLTGVAILAAAVILSTLGQTNSLLAYQRSRVPIMDGRAKAAAHNQRVIIDNQLMLCSHANLSCSADWQDAPER